MSQKGTTLRKPWSLVARPTGPPARARGSWRTTSPRFTRARHVPSQQRLVLERFLTNRAACSSWCIRPSEFASTAHGVWHCASGSAAPSISNCRRPRPTMPSCSRWERSISFPLEDVFHYLNTNTVRELLDPGAAGRSHVSDPMAMERDALACFATPAQRTQTPAPLQRMESENLLAAVFPDQLACLENIAGDRVVPEHPLVQQTIEDCLTEAMDFDGLGEVLRTHRDGAVELIARDLPEPSPLAHEILNAKPYAFLDNAPLEERRTQAVYLRRAADPHRGRPWNTRLLGH